MRDWWEDYGWITVVWTACFVGLVWICILAVRQHNEWEKACRDKGGEVLSHTSTGTVTTVSGDGKIGVGTTSDTTYYCVIDGKVVDIQ